MFTACLELLVLLDIISGYCCSVIYNNLTVFENSQFFMALSIPSPIIPHPLQAFYSLF